MKTQALRLLAFLIFIFLCPQFNVQHANAHTQSVLKSNKIIETHAEPITTSKKLIFSVEKKQKLVKDTIPESDVKTPDSLQIGSNENALNDTIPKHTDSAAVHVPDSLLTPEGGVDTLKLDSLRQLGANETALGVDSLPKDTIPYRLSKDALSVPVEAFAKDSMVLDVRENIATLYGDKSSADYQSSNITAPIIEVHQNTGDIRAALVLDSAGKVVGRPTYTNADFKSESDSIIFNIKTGKGLTKGTYTQQGEMYVHGESIKRVSDDVFYALRGQFTTCNLDTPHFAFVSNKIKFITDKIAITGPVHPEFEGVPIPLYLPFGIFPLQQERHGGILAPTFVTNQQRGIGLEGLGYYVILGEYWDVVARTSIYSYGGWSFNINPRYSKRYHYNGNLSFDMQHFNFNFKGDPDFAKNRSFNVRWSHSADTKARPGVSFSANVNAGSSSYNSFVPNNPMQNIQNSMQSSITYGKTWKGSPFNLTVSANHNQNTNLRQITLDLPTVNFSMATIYPFRPKERVGKQKWYENIGFGYQMNARSSSTFYDTVENKSIFSQMLDTLRWGAQHSVPISLTLPPMGVLQVSPNVSYSETWFQTRSTRRYNDAKDSIIIDREKGFYTARQVGFGLNLSTRIFGMFTAKNPKSKFVAMRHEMRPSMSISYQPDLQKNNYYYLTDSTGRRTQYSHYETRYNIYGGYSAGEFGGLNFSIDNNLSMKLKNSKDTTGKDDTKKISILDAFGISGSYNFLADSLKFSPISLRASTNLFNKVNLSAYGNLELYQRDSLGRIYDRLIWKDRPISFGRMTNASISLSTSFKGGDKKPGEDRLGPDEFVPDQGYDLDEFNREAALIQARPGEYADFNIPWSVNLSYSLTMNKNFLVGTGFVTRLNQNVNIGGTVNLTPKWQMGVQTYLNITQGTLDPLSLSLSRDLHCWQMAIAVGVGRYKFFSITLSPKSPVLRDLRVNKTQSLISL